MQTNFRKKVSEVDAGATKTEITLHALKYKHNSESMQEHTIVDKLTMKSAKGPPAIVYRCMAWRISSGVRGFTLTSSFVVTELS